MASDLNKLLILIQKDSKSLEQKMKELMVEYEELYRSGNRQYIEERTASNSTEGLEEFYVLIQTVRRNRDVMGSLLRGINNLRSLERFKIVEKNIPSPRQAKKREKVEAPVLPPEILSPVPEEMNG
jgi:hypothetical protein